MNEFIPYLKAKKLLQNRLGATAEEIAGWIYMGPALGAKSCGVKSYPTKHANLPAYRHWPCLPSTGLAAYTNANEFDEPPRFHFDDEHGDDYLAPLMGCWFKAVSIAAFQPQDRYITGQALRARWQAELGDQVDAYIRSKILESRLMGFHPIEHGTKWDDDDRLPPKGSALFELAHVEAIEAEDGIGSTVVIDTDVGGKVPKEWVPQARKIGENWMHAEEKRTKKRPGIVAIAKHIEGEFKRLDIRSKRLNDYLDWQSIKKEITGITGRNRGENFKTAMGKPQRKRCSPNVKA